MREFAVWLFAIAVVSGAVAYFEARAERLRKKEATRVASRDDLVGYGSLTGRIRAPISEIIFDPTTRLHRVFYKGEFAGAVPTKEGAYKLLDRAHLAYWDRVRSDMRREANATCLREFGHPLFDAWGRWWRR